MIYKQDPGTIHTAELLSRTTAITLTRYFRKTDAEELASILEKIYLWFSISNSYSPYAKLKTPH